MSKNEVIFDGNEKKVIVADNQDEVIIHFKDVATAFDGIKRAVLKGKGKCNCHISSVAFGALTEAGVPNHFIKALGDRDMLCRRASGIPVQMIVRNKLAGTTAKLLGVEVGTNIPNTVVELRYNREGLYSPMINDDHAVALGLLSYEELSAMHGMANTANVVLKELFHKAGIELIDFKLEFGRTSDGQIVIYDEISPDNCRLWDETTGEVLDKDRFRHDMSDVCAAYREVNERVTKTLEK